MSRDAACGWKYVVSAVGRAGRPGEYRDSAFAFSESVMINLSALVMSDKLMCIRITLIIDAVLYPNIISVSAYFTGRIIFSMHFLGATRR